MSLFFLLQNRQAHDLIEFATPEQARAIKEPLAQVNRRWEDLNKGINVRQKELEQVSQTFSSKFRH